MPRCGETESLTGLRPASRRPNPQAAVARSQLCLMPRPFSAFRDKGAGRTIFNLLLLEIEGNPSGNPWV